VAGRTPDATEVPPAGFVCLQVLRKRIDFLRAARARHQATTGFVLQARARDEAPSGGPRVGYTCSKKVGNAVTRNRAKRRLRAIAREVLCAEGRPGWDYVLIGRRETTVTRPHAALLADLRRALDRIHRRAE